MIGDGKKEQERKRAKALQLKIRLPLCVVWEHKSLRGHAYEASSILSVTGGFWWMRNEGYYSFMVYFHEQINKGQFMCEGEREEEVEINLSHRALWVVHTLLMTGREGVSFIIPLTLFVIIGAVSERDNDGNWENQSKLMERKLQMKTSLLVI